MGSTGDFIFEKVAPTAVTLLPMAGPWGAAAAAGIGAAQMIYGIAKNKKAKSEMPTGYDPRIMMQISDLNRRRNNAMTGANVSESLRTALTQRAAGLQALARSGNINQYGVLDRLSADNVNKALAQGQESELAYSNALLGLERDQSARKFSIDSLKYAQDRAAGQKMIQSGMSNAMGGLAGALTPKAVDTTQPGVISGATPTGMAVAPTSLNIGQPELTDTKPTLGGMNFNIGETVSTIPPIESPQLPQPSAGLGGLLYSDPTTSIPGVNANPVNSSDSFYSDPTINIPGSNVMPQSLITSELTFDPNKNYSTLFDAINSETDANQRGLKSAAIRRKGFMGGLRGAAMAIKG